MYYIAAAICTMIVFIVSFLATVFIEGGLPSREERVDIAILTLIMSVFFAYCAGSLHAEEIKNSKK